MKCPDCGFENAGTSGFCAGCGQKLEATASAPQVKVNNKKEYLAKVAPAPVQKKAKLGKLLSVVCLALLLICYFVVMGTSLEKIPVVNMTLESEGSASDFDDMKDELEELVDEMEDQLEEEEEELEDLFGKKEIKNVKNFLKSVKKCAKSMSVRNMNNMVKQYEKLFDSDIAEEMELDANGMDELQEVNEILSTIRTILLIGALVCALFVVLGGLTRSGFLTVFGMILTLIYTIVLCGWLWVILNFAAQLAMMICNSKANRAWKDYRKAVA